MDIDDNSLKESEKANYIPSLLKQYKNSIDFDFFENFNSPHTKAAYKRDLLQFFRFIRENFGELASYNDLSKTHVVAFKKFLSQFGGQDGKPAAPKTIYRKLTAISVYCDYLISKDLLSRNIMVGIKRPYHKAIKSSSALTNEQVKKLFTTLNTQATPLMHQALLVMLFTTGLRKQEIIQLKRKNYTEHEHFRVVECMTKSGKPHRIPLHPYCIKVLDQYLKQMNTEGREHDPEDSLFRPNINRSGSKDINKSLSRSAVDLIVKKYIKKIGIRFKVSPHSARATVITSLLEKGVDIYKVALMVNHSNVNTTKDYDKRDKKLGDSPVFQLDFF